MQRSGIREGRRSRKLPDSAALHPGYMATWLELRRFKGKKKGKEKDKENAWKKT
ncbi:MAG: hypothetical protein Q8Q28_17430 [Pseudomonadota bacterium]|nr:hypothetical protein [Pseudomonadota bacterium]